MECFWLQVSEGDAQLAALLLEDCTDSVLDHLQETAQAGPKLEVERERERECARGGGVRRGSDGRQSTRWICVES